MRTKKRLIYKCVGIVAVYCAILGIVSSSNLLSVGILNGLNISFKLIVPSLFIFMVFSDIVLRSRIKSIISYPFRAIGKYIFKLPSELLYIPILSLIGGYPIGAKLLSDAVKAKTITQERASWLLCCCVNCGPAFLINALGSAVLGNPITGVIIYISQITACVCIGFITARLCKDNGITSAPHELAPIPMSATIVNAVNNTMRTLAMLCGFIVLFSAFLPLIDKIPFKSPIASIYLSGLLEVVSGCNSLSGSSMVLQAALFTAFGGICVFIQVAAIAKTANISMKKFLIFRAPYTLISVGIVYIIQLINPQLASCASIAGSVIPKIYSVSPIATASLILLSIMLLFFCKKSDRIE